MVWQTAEGILAVAVVAAIERETFRSIAVKAGGEEKDVDGER